MNARNILENILDGNPSRAKDGLELALYNKVGESMRENVSFAVARNFREENAASDSIILGEECDCETDDDCECHEEDFNEADQSPEQKAYRALFNKILKKYGADSPNDLEDSKKDDFFNEVGKAWKSDPANDDEGIGEDCAPCRQKQNRRNQR
jgi:hypothetical protein